MYIQDYKETVLKRDELEEKLIKCILEAPLRKEVVDALVDTIQIRTYEAGDILLRAGQIAVECYHNLQGCVRQYYLVDGEEVTTFFYTEGQNIGSYASTTRREPARHYLTCVEETALAVLTPKQENELYRKFPRLESLARAGMEEQLGDYQEMLANYITTTPEERYLDLMENRPELLNRVPQYQLASYIGVKPESLSRIRRRIMVEK